MRILSLLVLTVGLGWVSAQTPLPNAKTQSGANIKDLGDALKYLKSDQTADRAFALSFLGLMKDDARSASKEIVAAFFDPSPDVRQVAAMALKDVNNPLYGPVSTLAKSDDYDAKMQAIKDLAAMGADAAPTLPAMLKFLPDARGGDKVDIIKTLVDIGAKDNALAPALTKLALTDSDNTVRAAALKALPNVANASGQVAGVLDALNAGQTTAQGRTNAINVLAAIGKDNADANGALQRFLLDPSPEVRAAAEKALGK